MRLGGRVECCRATAYDVNSKQPKWAFEATSYFRSLRYTAGDQAVVAVAEYGPVRVLDATSGVPMTLLPEAVETSVPVLSADGSTVWRFQLYRV
jgi:hypothetical protein